MWGALPAFSLINAFGLLLVALGYDGGRQEAWWTDLAFWGGISALFVPTAARLLTHSATRAERLGLVVLTGMSLYVVKVLQDPLAFSYHDEFAHWRTASDILDSGWLFQTNPIIAISAYYPGLEVVTAALASLGNTSLFVAGVLVLGAARLVLMVSLYLLFEEAVPDPRVASIAALLYTANPNFVFFDSQFSYESLALPLAILTLFLVARRARAGTARRVGLTLLALLAIGAIVRTHHITAYAVAALLATWTLVALVRLRYGGHDRVLGLAGITLFAIGASVAWVMLAARITVGYLTPVLSGAVTELLRWLSGEVATRVLFKDFAGNVAPAWERAAGTGSVVLILLVLPFGLWQLWKHYRQSTLALLLGISALAYPASLALRLTYFGAETSNRSSEFVFVPLAFVLAVWMCHLRGPNWADASRIALLAAWAGVVFVGGVIVGTPRWGRIPGPYLVSADARSIGPEGVDAAEWTRDTLGPGNRVATDRINGLLMGSYGDQMTMRYTQDGTGISWVFFAPDLGAHERDLLRQVGVRYVIVDQRLSTGLPTVGIYFEMGEPDTYAHSTPMDPAALAKFDSVPGVSRVFDSGNIVIYDIQEALNGA
jgi:hypothetical protein